MCSPPLLKLIRRSLFFPSHDNQNQFASNPFYSYSPKSQSHCRSGLYNLYSERYPHNSSEQNVPHWGKNLLTRDKKKDGRNMRWDRSPRTDRHAIDVAYTEQNNTITVHMLHWQDIWYKLWNISKVCGSRRRLRRLRHRQVEPETQDLFFSTVVTEESNDWLHDWLHSDGHYLKAWHLLGLIGPLTIWHAGFENRLIL